MALRALCQPKYARQRRHHARAPSSGGCSSRYHRCYADFDAMANHGGYCRRLTFTACLCHRYAAPHLSGDDITDTHSMPSDATPYHRPRLDINTLRAYLRYGPLHGATKRLAWAATCESCDCVFPRESRQYHHQYCAISRAVLSESTAIFAEVSLIAA